MVKIGVNLSPVRSHELADVARTVEELGFDAISMGEHIAVPVNLRIPYKGKVGYNARTYQIEPYVGLAYCAAVTKRVELFTGITILPLREPLVTAREIMSVDVLSNGRLHLAIGSGSIEEEFEVMGYDFASRGRRMDEMVEIFDKLWSQDEIVHEGEFYKFREIGFVPKPVQKPRPPLYIGSASKAGMKRAARYADGWYGACYGPEAAKKVMDTIKGHMDEYGRDPTGFRYTLIHASGEGIMPTEDDLKGYDEIGVETIIVSPFGKESGDGMQRVREMAAEFKLKPQ